MSIEKAKECLANFGKADNVLEFEVSSVTVELAVAADGCEPERIAKTLSFAAGDRVAFIVCAGDARIANPKFKAVFETKPKMLAAARNVLKGCSVQTINKQLYNAVMYGKTDERYIAREALLLDPFRGHSLLGI